METRNIVTALATVGAAVAGYGVHRWRAVRNTEIERLSQILGWNSGRTVADVGAGSGDFAIAAAKRVGPDGRVFAVEADQKKVRLLRRKIAKQHLANVNVIEAEADDVGLSPASCDAILLRGVYHHISNPAALNASLFRALRQRGVLAILDFPPRWWLSVFAPVKGVPSNRGGHGIPRGVLLKEVDAAGFKTLQVIESWWRDVYCIVLEKTTGSVRVAFSQK